MKYKQIFVLLFFAIVGLLFMRPAIFGRDIALPGDILIGHYYPWRDYVWDGRPSGYPIKNFDLSDAVTAFFPWRKFTVEQFSQGIIPFRNPYNFLGTPHMANISAAVFYPLSIIFYIMPFFAAWDIFILLQIVLSGFFMYLFLKNLKLDSLIAIYGGVAFCLSSYIMTTLEYSVIGHTALWAPLILFSIDRLLETKKIRYLVLGTLAGLCLFLAGFIQVSLYVYALSIAYFIFKAKWKDYWYLGIFIFPVFLSLFQLLPFAQVAVGSSRIAGYFSGFSDARKYLVPAVRLIGGLVPDYYGNPAKWNFIGNISYTEFAFYLGVPSVIFTVYALGFFKKNRQIKFWSIALFTSLLLLVNNPFSKLLHTLNLPFYSTFLPSRLLSILTISLVVLSSFGLSMFKDNLIKNKRGLISISKVVAAIFLVFVFYGVDSLALFVTDRAKGMVSLRNLLYSFIIFSVVSISILIVKSFHKVYSKKAYLAWMVFLVVFTLWDLMRQGKTYNAFIDESLAFPKTPTLEYLSSQEIAPRVVTTHQELLPAEANMYYDFSLIGGYDTVHSAKTERMINALNYGSDDIDRVSGRVVFVSSLTSSRYDILSPEYYYILDEAGSPSKNMELVASDGRAKLYKNNGAFPRAFLTRDVKKVVEEGALTATLAVSESRSKTAIVTSDLGITSGKLEGNVEMLSDKDNDINLKVKTDQKAVVVLNQSYDKNWKAKNLSTGEDINLLEINYHLTGFVANPGEYNVRLSYSPDSFYLGAKISALTALVFLGYILLLRRLDKANI